MFNNAYADCKITVCSQGRDLYPIYSVNIVSRNNGKRYNHSPLRRRIAC